MIKTLQKVNIEGTYLNIINATFNKPTANIIFNGKKLKAFLTRPGTRQGCPLLSLLFNSLGSPSSGNQRKKEIKGIQTGKEVELSLLADDMILYTENPQDETRKLLALIHEPRKPAGYKLIHINLLHLYILTIKD